MKECDMHLERETMRKSWRHKKEEKGFFSVRANMRETMTNVFSGLEQTKMQKKNLPTGFSGFSDSRYNSCATTRDAVSSEIGPWMHTIRSFRSLEKMS
jgi:hypothetical protein